MTLRIKEPIYGKHYTSKQIKQMLGGSEFQGMRYSKKFHHMTLTSKILGNSYPDIMKGNILNYTGTGLYGNQSMTSVNKKLKESNVTHLPLYLFLKTVPKKYYYAGPVKLSGKPFPKTEGNRKVIIFPIATATNEPQKIRKLYNHLKDIKKVTKESKKDIHDRRSVNRKLKPLKNTPLGPITHATSPKSNRKPKKSQGPKKPNYNKKHYYNENLGEIGEEKIYKYEKNKLLNSKFPELANKVRWTSKHNDRAGYDISSFDKNSGHPIQIEVKTTSSTSKNGSFYMSQNEWDTAASHKSSYRLIYIFNNHKSHELTPVEYTFTNLLEAYKRTVSFMIWPNVSKNASKNKNSK